MNDNALIILIEDDPQNAALVTSVLKEGGYTVMTADTAQKGRTLLQKNVPQVLILDRNLPDADGSELCAEVRKHPDLHALPVLFLTARKSVEDKVEGLELGADDYLTKPFSPAELLARVRAILRRISPEAPAQLKAGDLKLDMRSRKAYIGDKQIDLWAKEFDLLAILMHQSGRVLTRDFLLQQVWSYQPDNQPNTKVVDVTLSHLRAKLGDYAAKIVSVRGFGYRFDP